MSVRHFMTAIIVKITNQNIWSSHICLTPHWYSNMNVLCITGYLFRVAYKIITDIRHLVTYTLNRNINPMFLPNNDS